MPNESDATVPRSLDRLALLAGILCVAGVLAVAIGIFIASGVSVMIGGGALGSALLCYVAWLAVDAVVESLSRRSEDVRPAHQH